MQHQSQPNVPKGYTKSDKMRSVIADNTQLLMVLSRFGIALGFGDATVGEVCEQRGVDCPTFLAVANFISGYKYNIEDVKPSSLIGYLKQAHNFFLDFYLPDIRRKLIDALSTGNASAEISLLLLKFYDDYVGEVRRHMAYEDKYVFTYVENLMSGRLPGNFRISRFLANHRPIASKLNELKEVFICHYGGVSGNMLNSVLYDIVTCENDLLSHCRVEDNLFVPVVQKLENNIPDSDPEPLNRHDDTDKVELTQREKEIISCIARGMSNKEIADKLCLSIHTVTTHRRNIGTKLDVHSAAGLTIYAIVNGIIDLSEVRIAD